MIVSQQDVALEYRKLSSHCMAGKGGREQGNPAVVRGGMNPSSPSSLASTSLLLNGWAHLARREAKAMKAQKRGRTLRDVSRSDLNDEAGSFILCVE